MLMKKAIVLTADKFEDMEVMYPLFRLQEEGWQVDVVAPKILNPLLRKFDIERYFADDSDNRVGARKTFDFKIFENLHDLFSQDEVGEVFLDERKKTFKDKLHSGGEERFRIVGKTKKRKTAIYCFYYT